MLARQGYQVAGIDLSAPMIAQARSKAEELGLNIRFEARDAAEFQLGEKFDAACSFFDSFNYITDLGRLGMAFRRVAEHLHPGGSFIFDVNTAYAFEAQMFDQADTRKKTRLKYEWVGEYDPTSKIIHVHMDFWTETERFKEVHTQRAHSHEEIIDLLGEAGFGTIMAYEAYTLDRPRQKSDRIFYTCIRES
jgi:SAM-dependent methyltransferase